MNTTQQGGKHLCIKKEDGLYLVQPTMKKLTEQAFWKQIGTTLQFDGEGFHKHRDEYRAHLQSLPAIKCTDGFIEGKEYEVGKDCYIVPARKKGATDGDAYEEIAVLPLLPALKEDSGEEELKEMYYQQNVLNPYPEESQSRTAYKKGFYECFELILNNYTITKK